MITSDVILRVRRTFGDEAAVQIQDADIFRWINDAQVEIVKRNDQALQKSAFVDLVANQSQYTMPTDLMLLRSLRYKYSDMQAYSALTYKNMQQFDESVDGWDGSYYSAGHPGFYTMFEGKAMLFPTPDQSNVSGLKVLYNQKPTDVIDGTSALTLPLIYHNTVVRYCLWQASLLDEDLDPATVYRSDFQDDMGLLQNRETKENTALYPTITVLDYDS